MISWNAFLSGKYLLGLLIALTIEVVAWLTLVFLVAPERDLQGRPRSHIDRTEWIALGTSIATGLLSWLQMVIMFSAGDDAMHLTL